MCIRDSIDGDTTANPAISVPTEFIDTAVVTAGYIHSAAVRCDVDIRGGCRHGLVYCYFYKTGDVVIDANTAECRVWTTLIRDVEKCPLPVSYTHLRAHETVLELVCRLLL